jgi:transposase-like protein
MPKFVPTEELFKGRHFDQQIVVLCVRWYLSFKLSFRDLVEMMNERGVGLAHTTILEVGAALHSGIRKAMEAIRAHHWRVLAGG